MHSSLAGEKKNGSLPEKKRKRKKKMSVEKKDALRTETITPEEKEPPTVRAKDSAACCPVGPIKITSLRKAQMENVHN